MKYLEDLRQLGNLLEPEEYLEIINKMSPYVAFVVATYPQWAYLEQALKPEERHVEETRFFSVLKIGNRMILRCRSDDEI